MAYKDTDYNNDIIDFCCSFKIRPEYISFVIDGIYKKDLIKDYDGDINNVPLQYRELILRKMKTELNNVGHWHLDELNDLVFIGIYFYKEESRYEIIKKLENLARYIVVPISTKIYECRIKHKYGVEDKWEIKHITDDELHNRVFYFYNKIDNIVHGLDDNGNIISTTITYKYPIDVDNTDRINSRLFKLD